MKAYRSLLFLCLVACATHGKSALAQSREKDDDAVYMRISPGLYEVNLCALESYLNDSTQPKMSMTSPDGQKKSMPDHPEIVVSVAARTMVEFYCRIRSKPHEFSIESFEYVTVSECSTRTPPPGAFIPPFTIGSSNPLGKRIKKGQRWLSGPARPEAIGLSYKFTFSVWIDRKMHTVDPHLIITR